MDPRDYQGPARNTTQDKLMQIYHQMRRWRLAGRAMRTVGILAKAGQAGQAGLPRWSKAETIKIHFLMTIQV